MFTVDCSKTHNQKMFHPKSQHLFPTSTKDFPIRVKNKIGESKQPRALESKLVLATMKSKEDAHPLWLTGAALVGGASAAIVYARLRRRRRRTVTHEDHLDHLQSVRHQLSKPRHSHFRVVCKLILDNNETILGTNDEPAIFMGGAICAERAALCQYRILYGRQLDKQQHQHQQLPKITHLYIVTDATTPITPGCLCREYLYGHPGTNANTQIVLQSCEKSSPYVTTTLERLYPYPSPMVQCRDSQHALQVLPEIAKKQQQQLPDDDNDLRELYHAAFQAARDSHNNNKYNQVYPIAFGAAARTEKGASKSLVAHQCPALEYGNTMDAVSRLLAVLNDENNNDDEMITIIQCDHFGTIHAPFAPARSQLSEYYPDTARVVVVDDNNQTNNKKWNVVAGRDLVPIVPNIFSCSFS